jgi:hypothetical protein
MSALLWCMDSHLVRAAFERKLTEEAKRPLTPCPLPIGWGEGGRTGMSALLWCMDCHLVGVGFEQELTEEAKEPLTPALSPSDGARENCSRSLWWRMLAFIERRCLLSLAPSDGERVGVRGDPIRI